MQTAQLAEAAQEKQYVAPAEKKGYEFCKRVLDILLSAFALLVLSPVLLVVALIIWVQDWGNPIFAQTRLTKGGREFKMYKFRSMRMNAEAELESLLHQNEVSGPAFKLENDPRVTKFGRFIRKTSIDELPQLLNILKGDMSIIGPRPPLPREVALYTSYQMHRLDVKTGLSCYHECQGRSEEKDFDRWVEADLKYIRERSLWVDFKIILMTIRVVLTGKGAM